MGRPRPFTGRPVMSTPVPTVPLAARPAVDAPRRSVRATLARGAGQVLASQIVLALAGLATLPVLGRTLGLAHYGEFSLFVTLLGVVAYQDVARQLLIHEQARREPRSADLAALSRLSTVLIVALAAVVGAFVLSFAAAAALVLATTLHGLASRDYARLAIAGRVGAATSIRNFAWAGAFASVAALSLVSSGPLVFAGPFVVANLVTWLAYRSLVGPWSAESVDSTSDSWWARASGWATLARSPELPRYRTAVKDLLGFTLAAAAITSIERVLLDLTAGADQLSLYSGAADLALRIQVVGSALSAAIYPTFAKLVSERGEAQAARQFLRVASWVVPAYFLGLLALLALDSTLLSLLLGPAFAESRPLFVLLLLGVFVHSFGYLLTPWQRARGDFATPRKSYVRAAVVMLAVGCLAVPAWGALGAVLAYLSARTAELQLAIVELRRMPRHLRAGRRFAAAAAMFVVLCALCLWRWQEAA